MKYFRSLANTLKTEWPAKYPVSVRTYKYLPYHGDCDLLRKGRRKYFRIRIERHDESVMVHFLLHEWAHALSWEHHQDADHPNAWGKQFAKIYRWWEDTL